MSVTIENEGSYKDPSHYTARLETTVLQLQKAIVTTQKTCETNEDNDETFNFQTRVIQPFTLIFSSLQNDICIVQKNIPALLSKFNQFSRDKDSQLTWLTKAYQELAEAYEKVLFQLKDALQEKKQLEEKRRMLSKRFQTSCSDLATTQASLRRLQREVMEKESETHSLETELKKAQKEITSLHGNQAGLSREFFLKAEAIQKLDAKNKELAKEIAKKTAELKQTQTILMLAITSTLVAGIAFFALNEIAP